MDAAVSVYPRVGIVVWEMINCYIKVSFFLFLFFFGNYTNQQLLDSHPDISSCSSILRFKLFFFRRGCVEFFIFRSVLALLRPCLHALPSIPYTSSKMISAMTPAKLFFFFFCILSVYVIRPSRKKHYLEYSSDNPNTHTHTYTRRRKESQTTTYRTQQPSTQRGQTATYQSILGIPQ